MVCLFTPGWSPAYLFEVVFVKYVCIWRTSVFFQFYGVLSGVIYNYSPPTFFLYINLFLSYLQYLVNFNWSFFIIFFYFVYLRGF